MHNIYIYISLFQQFLYYNHSYMFRYICIIIRGFQTFVMYKFVTPWEWYKCIETRRIYCNTNIFKIKKIYMYCILLVEIKSKHFLGDDIPFLCTVKSSPVTGLEWPRGLRFQDFVTRSQDGGKVFSLTHRPTLPQKMLLVLIAVRDRVDHRVTVRSEGFYDNEKYQWHQLGSKERPSDL